MTTFGHKSSERKACYHAFYASVLLAAWGLYSKVDLSGLALLLPAVSAPMMWYAGARSYVKVRKNNEE